MQIPVLVDHNTSMESIIGEWWQDGVQVRVFAAGTVTLGTWWRYRFERLTHWRFYANNRDGASLKFDDGSELALAGGSAYLIPPGPTLETHASVPVEHFYAHLDITGLPEVAMRRLFSEPIRLPSSPALQGLTAEAMRRLRERPADQPQQWRIKAIVYEGLTLYLETLSEERVQGYLEAMQGVTPVLFALRRIQDAYATPLPNLLLANLCGMSEDHFIRRFRECTGQTPAQHVLRYRLRMAMQQLLFSDKTIEQIAVDSGFCHRAHLIHTMKAHEGMTPAQYRRQMRPV